MDHSPKFLALVEDVKKRVKEITISQLKARQAKGEALFVVDVREDNEWDKGRIPGSVHMGRGILERDIEKAVPDPKREIILYCGGGFRSALSADNLQKMGYTNVLSLAGGWREWTSGGNPTERD
ncbi:MAG: sulfurtransferase [Elusimicrobia bacterium]|nr:sulfurtransferase [Elusimicrobiota bacterium]